MSSNGAVYAVCLIAVIALIGAWTYFRVIARLKLRHGLVWEELGRPGIFKASSILVELRFAKFVFLRRYANLSDRKISMLGDVWLACWAMQLCLFLYLISIACADFRACFGTRWANLRDSIGIGNVVTPAKTNGDGIGPIGTATEEKIAIGLWLLNAILALSYLVLAAVMKRNLRKLYPGTWKALGQPSLLNNSIQNTWIFGKFIFTRRYASLSNSKIARIGDAMLVLSVLLLCSLVSFTLLMWSVGGDFAHSKSSCESQSRSAPEPRRACHAALSAAKSGGWPS
jgi:hypothetical protein